MLVHCLAFGMCFFSERLNPSHKMMTGIHACYNSSIQRMTDSGFLSGLPLLSVLQKFVPAHVTNRVTRDSNILPTILSFYQELVIEVEFSSQFSFLILVLFIAVCTFIKYLIWSWTELWLYMEWKCDEQIEKWDENVTPLPLLLLYSYIILISTNKSMQWNRFFQWSVWWRESNPRIILKRQRSTTN